MEVVCVELVGRFAKELGLIHCRRSGLEALDALWLCVPSVRCCEQP